MSETQDTLVMDQHDQYSFQTSPRGKLSPRVTDEFGGLKKNEAIELFFKRLN